MTMKLSLLLTANSKQAEAELRKVVGQLEKVGVSAQEAGTKGKVATDKLGSGARTAEAATEQLAAAQQRSAAAGVQMAAANTNAAGSVGNLTAQFNDIGVMLAAGQNPLMLALQQGTQITQVIGPMGAAGAVKSLGAAFVGMLSPVSLITIGSIAAGAAMIQWLTSGVGGAENLDDALSTAESTLSDYIELISKSDSLGGAQFEQTRRELETASQAYRDLIAIAKIEAFNGIESLNQSLVSSITNASWLKTELADVGSLLDIDIARRSGDDRAIVSSFAEDLDKLKQAASLDAQYAAALGLRDSFKETVDVSGDLTAEQLEFWKTLSLSIQQMELLGAATQQQEQFMAGAVAQFQQFKQEQFEAGFKATENANALLVQLNEEAAIRQAITQYGEDSRQVAELRVGAERRVFQELIASEEVSDSMRAKLLAAWDAANGVAGSGMSGPISAAAQEAARLADNLNIAYGEALKLRAARAAPYVSSGRGQDPSLFDSENRFSDRFSPSPEIVEQANLILRPPPPRRSSLGRGAGGAGGAAQVDQVAQLTERLRDELAVLRETDPVQKELLRNREALSRATEGERATITDLIGQRIEETRVLAAQQEQWDLMSSTATNALDALIVQGESLDDVLKNVIVSLIDAGIQAAALGTGPFGDLFGGTNSSGRGGFLGSLFGSVFGGGGQKSPLSILGFKEGGMIYGPGTGTSDDVLLPTSQGPIWGSSGEFMVNASATAKHRALLEAINAGSPIPAYAKGGAIGGGGAGGRAAGGAGGSTANFTLDLRGAQGNSEIQAAAYAGMQLALEEFSRSALVDRVQQINADPRLIG